MRRTATMTLWDQLWHSHDQVKNLLMCALPTSSTGSASSRSHDDTQGSGGHSPRPPAYNTPQKVGLVLGPLLFALVVMFFHPADLSFEGRMVLATTLWVAVWWITEAIPIPVTSLLPIILLPITGALDGNTVTAAYGNPIIFLFLGGFYDRFGDGEVGSAQAHCACRSSPCWGTSINSHCIWLYGRHGLFVHVGVQYCRGKDDAGPLVPRLSTKLPKS